MSALLKHEIYKEYIYYAHKTMCEYSNFFRKNGNIESFLSRLKKKKKKEKNILMHHTQFLLEETSCFDPVELES